MDFSRSISKLKNFAEDISISGANESEVEKIKANLLSGDSSLTTQALNDALSSFEIHDNIKSNAAFMRSFKQKNPAGYEQFNKYSNIIEEKKAKMPSVKDQQISATKKIRNIETMNKVGEALKKTMEDPLAEIFGAILDMFAQRGADAIKLAAMKDDATGLSLMDEAAALSSDGGASLKEAGVEVDDKAVAQERKNIAEGKGNSSFAAAGAIPKSTKEKITKNPTSTVSSSESSSSSADVPDIEVNDEKSARKLGESLGMIVHGENYDQEIFDEIFDKALVTATDKDGDVNYDTVAAYLKNVYRSAYHKDFSSKVNKSIMKLNKFMN